MASILSSASTCILNIVYLLRTGCVRLLHASE
jgi:hypothetical protein